MGAARLTPARLILARPALVLGGVLLLVALVTSGANTPENMTEGCWIDAPRAWGERVDTHADWRWWPLGVRCTHVHTATGEVRRTGEGWTPTVLAGAGLAALVAGAMPVVRTRLRRPPPTAHRPAAT